MSTALAALRSPPEFAEPRSAAPPQRRRSFNRDAEGAAADDLPIESTLIGRPRRRAAGAGYPFALSTARAPPRSPPEFAGPRSTAPPQRRRSFNRDAEGAAADDLPIESTLIGRPRRRARGRGTHLPCRPLAHRHARRRSSLDPGLRHLHSDASKLLWVAVKRFHRSRSATLAAGVR